MASSTKSVLLDPFLIQTVVRYFRLMIRIWIPVPLVCLRYIAHAIGSIAAIKEYSGNSNNQSLPTSYRFISRIHI